MSHSLIDYFALLGQPRRPHLDSELLKTHFISQSAQVHPDHFHQASASERDRATQLYSALNGAYQCLREPRDRVEHLLWLETGQKPVDVQEIPPQTVELFLQLGQSFKKVDRWLSQNREESSPLLQASRMVEAQHYEAVLEDHLRQVDAIQQQLQMKLTQLNPAWDQSLPLDPSARRAELPLDRLAQLLPLISYATKWEKQIRERLHQLQVCFLSWSH